MPAYIWRWAKNELGSAFLRWSPGGVTSRADPPHKKGEIVADPTRFETQLQEVLVALGACKAPAIEAFWALWRRARGPSLRTLDDFRAACDALPDGPLALGHRVHRVLLTPEWQQMRKSCPEELRTLIRCLALAAIERYLRGQPTVTIASVAGPVRIEMNDQLAADIVAAVHHGCGLAVAPHPQTGEWQAVSVRHDLPALAWGATDAAYEVCKADLLAWADSYQSAEQWIQQAMQTEPARGSGRLDAALVRYALDDVAKAFNLRPMFAIHQGSSSPLALDPALRQRLADDFGVHCYFYAPPPEGQALPVPAAELQTTLRRFVAEVFARSGRTDPAVLEPAARTATVFVSYAHADGEGWRDRIVRMIQGTGGSVQIDSWDDRRIETGASWRIEIERALAQASCAVLVLSPGFLESKFIRVVELPSLLGRARAEGLHLFPVLAMHCPWKTHDWLEERQLFPGSNPLAGRSTEDIDALLSELAEKIHRHLSR